MKIAIWGADTFVGSNFCHWWLQLTKHELVGFMLSPPPYSHMQAPIQSRSRFSYQCVGTDSISVENRLKAESPDLIICVDSFPSFLSDRYNTIYLGQDPFVEGAKRIFIYSGAFGPRQPKSEGMAAALIDGKEHPKNVIFIKELFHQFSDFVDSDSKFASSESVSVTDKDLSVAMSDGEINTQIQQAIRHTWLWYQSNTWFNK